MLTNVIMLYISVASGSPCAQFEYYLYSTSCATSCLSFVFWGHSAVNSIGSDEEWARKLLRILISTFLSSFAAFFAFKWVSDLVQSDIEYAMLIQQTEDAKEAEEIQRIALAEATARNETLPITTTTFAPEPEEETYYIFEPIEVRECIDIDFPRTLAAIFSSLVVILRIFFETAIFYIVFTSRLIIQMRYLSQMV